MIPNDIYTPEKYIITESHTFYKQLKSVIRQDYLISKEIFEENQKLFNPIKILAAFISEKTICFNPDLININNSEPYEIERQTQIGIGKVENINSENFSVVSAIPEYEQLCSLAEKQFIDWWENEVCQRIITKYGGINKANSKCQFARQLRNAFGHSKINIQENLRCVDPIWQYLNLKKFPGQKIFELMSLGDLVNFWIDFEETELN
ncbi:hypothetical protein B6A10_01775 [Flavobacterium sp. L1I52]|uniref:pEK499-p136 HEPN domain-containing protein n=1 Tax=Flavobacterium pokkalii TaxID=1940408 RepID=A0ABR7UM00_9FLAO|nr:hypothetical protein [Flavobacterium pokkalii]MBD0723902.1 hypothetical protein [Flavobacterium pokkalii]